MREMNGLKSSDLRADHWAAGVIILEILFVSKNVLALTEFDDFKLLTSSMVHYIDSSTR